VTQSCHPTEMVNRTTKPQTSPLLAPVPICAQNYGGSVSPSWQLAKRETSSVNRKPPLTSFLFRTADPAGIQKAYGFAPASLVAPLGIVALMANCIIAPVVLAERFRTRDIVSFPPGEKGGKPTSQIYPQFGMVLCLVGAMTVVYSSASENPRVSVFPLRDAFPSLSDRPCNNSSTLTSSLPLFPNLLLSHIHASVSPSSCKSSLSKEQHVHKISDRPSVFAQTIISTLDP
jgi:hypothetical protein